MRRNHIVDFLSVWEHGRFPPMRGAIIAPREINVTVSWSFTQSFWNVHASQGNEAFVFRVELRVILVHKFDQLVAVYELEIALGEGEIARSLIEAV